MMDSTTPDAATRQPCSSCRKPFQCDSECAHCWCCDYPAILPPDASNRCLCQTCLAKSIAAHIELRLDELDLDQAVALAQSTKRPRTLPVEYIDYTIEDGLWVFTRWFLLKRGKCCLDGCRNCPFPKTKQSRIPRS